VIAVAEDAPNPAGQTVSDLFASHFSDADDNQAATGGSSANVFAGVAVVANGQTPATGAWQYAAPGSTTWVNIGATVSDTGALLLEAALWRGHLQHGRVDLTAGTAVAGGDRSKQRSDGEEVTHGWFPMQQVEGQEA
jgi:hypothetical protein